MGTHQRMHRTRCVARIDDFHASLAQLAGAVAAGIVAAVAAEHLLFQCRRQRVPGFVHIRETGVAAGGRHFQGIEQAADRREVVVRHVGMPHRFVMAKVSDGFAVDLDVRHYGDLREGIDHILAGVNRC